MVYGIFVIYVLFPVQRCLLYCLLHSQRNIRMSVWIIVCSYCYCSVAKSCPPHGWQHTMLLCSSPSCRFHIGTYIKCKENLLILVQHGCFSIHLQISSHRHEFFSAKTPPVNNVLIKMTKLKFRKILKVARGKATNNKQGNPHKTISWSSSVQNPAGK